MIGSFLEFKNKLRDPAVTTPVLKLICNDYMTLSLSDPDGFQNLKCVALSVP